MKKFIRKATIRKNLFKNLGIYFLVIPMLLCNVISVSAVEITPKSGGIVNIKYTTKYVGSPKTTTKEYNLSAKHEHNSKIARSSVINATISKSISSTLTVSVSGDVMDDLKTEVGYGKSISSGRAASHSYTVYKDGFYQIKFKVTFKEQDIKQVATTTYYDTSTGYYTRTTTTNSHYKIPTNGYVYLKKTSK